MAVIATVLLPVFVSVPAPDTTPLRVRAPADVPPTVKLPDTATGVAMPCATVLDDVMDPVGMSTWLPDTANVEVPGNAILIRVKLEMLLTGDRPVAPVKIKESPATGADDPTQLDDVDQLLSPAAPLQVIDPGALTPPNRKPRFMP